MKLPLIVVVAVAAAAVGFFIGRATIPNLKAPATSTESPGAMSSDPMAGSSREPSVAESQYTDLSEPFTTDSLKALVLQLQSGSLDTADQARAWADFYTKLEASDLPMLAAALGATDGEQFETGIRALYAAWAEKDPAAAWNSALSFATSGDCNKAMHAVLDTVGKKDPSAAMAMAQALEKPSLREHMSSSALQSLAKADPGRAFEIALRSAERGDQSAFYSVLSQWTQEDPVAAQRAAANLKGQLGDRARMAVVQSLANLDPEAAWTYALSLPSSSERYSYWDPRTRVIALWSKKDPQRAIEAALTLTDQEIRNGAVAQAVDSWASADLGSAVAYAGAISDSGLRNNVLAQLSRNRNADPAAMFEVLLTQAPAGSSFGNAIGNLMNRWTQSNPQEAAAATLQLPPGQVLKAASRQVAREWASSASDANEVLAWVQQLPLGQARNQALESVFEIWSSRDARGAQTAWNALGADDKQQVMAALTEGWSRTQPVEATRWAVAVADQPGGSEALSRAVSAWAQSSPLEAATFVQSAPERTRPALTSRLIDQWYSADPFAAAEWLKRQPAGPAKDAGIASISMEIAGESPETALAWTKSMTSQSDRADQEKSILRRWMRNDPTQATAWIRTASLPADTKASLLSTKP